MNIWLLKDGEPLPIDSNKARLLRTGLIANTCSKLGHTVVWWTSTLDHYKKQYRVKVDTTIKIKQNYHIKLIHSCGYRKNVSLSDYYCLPNKLFEYCFSGIPVLASNFPDITTIVMQYGLGECTDLSTKNIREAIKKLERLEALPKIDAAGSQVGWTL